MLRNSDEHLGHNFCVAESEESGTPAPDQPCCCAAARCAFTCLACFAVSVGKYIEARLYFEQLAMPPPGHNPPRPRALAEASASSAREDKRAPSCCSLAYGSPLLGCRDDEAGRADEAHHQTTQKQTEGPSLASLNRLRRRVAPAAFCALTLTQTCLHPEFIVLQPPSNFEADTWSKLRAAVRAVHAKRAVGHSLEDLYRAVEDMCLQNLGSTVYDRLRSECEEHIESKLEALLGQTPDVLAFLSLMQACWTDHCEQMLTLRSIFLYLDRTFVMQVPLARTARPPECPAVPCVCRGRARRHRPICAASL